MEPEIVRTLREDISKIENEGKILNEFIDYELDDFNKKFRTSIFSVIENISKELVNTPKVIDTVCEYYYTLLKSDFFGRNWTGLVFVGFGEKEIYPSGISVKVAEVIDNRLRYVSGEYQQVSENQTGVIMPFAQRDVIDTIIMGVSDDMFSTFTKTFNLFLGSYNRMVIDLVKNISPDIAQKISELNIDKITGQYQQELLNVLDQKHIQPTIAAVSLLSKEDLAEMAESLIYLTYLKRRISFDEESVGGPVDVALISKGDGFIWIKRKHYFDPKLNPSFFDKYFKT